MKDNDTLIIHRKILFELFSNLEKYVSINRLTSKLPYNYRTISNHLKTASSSYKERNKVQENCLR